ncbi:MAG TPA: hypothetical protein DER01_12985 [Phycisphaerales bacterium]|nr:hypothetical protein [Phycisphaerales bacterium]|tara:strand:+ start:218 stop:451 length:234 start_codon:yes stop_codon:yes gene_type:complete
MNSDRQFWGNQPRKRQVMPGSRTMKLIQVSADHDDCQSFELVLGMVRIELTASELLKMKTLVNRGAELYKDSLTEDI